VKRGHDLLLSPALQGSKQRTPNDDAHSEAKNSSDERCRGQADQLMCNEIHWWRHALASIFFYVSPSAPPLKWWPSLSAARTSVAHQPDRWPSRKDWCSNSGMVTAGPASPSTPWADRASFGADFAENLARYPVQSCERCNL